MGNPFCHIELHSNDPEASKKFYSSLLDWELKDIPMGDTTYTLIEVGGKGTGGGIMKSQAPEGTPPFWLSYILVDDIRAKTDKAKELGATILHDVTQIPDMGKFSIIQDPTGAMVAFFKDESQPEE